jgi:23S rRNA (pseudouridine1915-N3)-methyltransferase
LRITIVAVGKIKEPGLRQLIDDYLKRIHRYSQVQEVEFKDDSVDKITERIQKAIPLRSRVIALEVSGKTYTSSQFATLLEHSEHDAIGTLVFVIGGAYGLPQEISRSAYLKLSLSPMTLPHRLARLFLVEQIYRGFSISRNEPYAHE